MTASGHTDDAGEPSAPRRLCVYAAGLLRPRIRRIAALAGYRLTPGLPPPGPGDGVAVWGRSPYAPRGERVAAARDVPLVRLEDPFLRALFPGRRGGPPAGLLIDRTGVHFDPTGPSDLETLLARHPLDDTALMDRARAATAWMRRAHLSKYAATDPEIAPPDPGYVLVIDQVAGDASVAASRADRPRFLEMLMAARDENPGARIVLRTHPETARGLRPGHFRAEDVGPGIELCDTALSPWALLEGAVAVYTVSSQLGFEAILAGHRPRVFGGPFYAGWGLSDDEEVFPRRSRALSRTQLAAAALLLYPVWYDPFRDRRAEIEDVLAALEARARAWREDRHGWSAGSMRLWKRGHLQRFFGQHRAVRFEGSPETDGARRRMVWGSAEEAKAVRVEDGFLRSRGLGAALVPPVSLVLDDLGLYYDPRQPSRLERLIAESPALSAAQLDRAARLRARIVAAGLTKYNLAGAMPDLPEGRRVLVTGQVADDASMRLGAPAGVDNAALLARARAENPEAVLLWKPHPDVEAGLRPGQVPEAGAIADAVLRNVGMEAALDAADALWTLTSLAGFEALLRGLPVTTLGAPFYAGWGLTRDLGPVPARRGGGPPVTLDGLVHATLIAYPRYLDPVTRAPCPVEVIVDRLEAGIAPRGGPGLRTVSKLQGLLASRAHLWRR